jgi:YVTN family beta-propeller protein
VYIVDGYSDKIQEIMIGYGLGEVAVDPIEFGNTGSLIFVNNQFNNTIEVIDGGTNKVIKSIALENSPYRIGLDPIINRIFVTSPYLFPSEITVIDYLTDMNRNIEIQKKSIRNLGIAPLGVWVDSSIKKAFFVDIWNNTVFAVDSITLNQKSIIMNKTGLHPNSISFNPKNSMLYVGNSGENFVTALNVSTGKSQPIYTDSPIIDIAIDQDNDLVYLANYESQTLTKINSLNNKSLVTVNFQIFPENAGYIECNNKKINSNEFVTLELGAKCSAYSTSGYEFTNWVEKKPLSISNKTRITFEESIIYLFNNISKKFFNFYSNNNNNNNQEKTISKNEVVTAKFVSSSLFESIKLAGPSLSIIVLFISTSLVVFGPSIIYKKNNKKKQSQQLTTIDILGIDAGIIAGVLIFLSLTEGFEVSEQTQITIITVNIVFPFTISAILAVINIEKYASRLMIGGFVNLIIAVILIAIMKI